MIELTILQQELAQLPQQQRLQLTHWLLDSLVEPANIPTKETVIAMKHQSEENPLSEWVGIFSGGSVDTAERAEEILEHEINKVGGWGGS